MASVVRRINGVSPEVVDSSSVSDLGSENRTRFLGLLGVAGGVDMLWYPDFGARESIREQRFRSRLMPLSLLTALGRSSAIIIK